MSITQTQIDSFHRFASEKIANGGADLSWDELFIQWQSDCERDEINTAIREGLADVEAGRCLPAAEAMEEIRKEFGLAE
jgi:hypothetical protein